MHDDKRFGTRCIHAGQRPDPSTGAITTPIYMTSTYVQSSPGEFIDGYDYSRSKNPTRQALEDNLASRCWSTVTISPALVAAMPIGYLSIAGTGRLSS